MTYYDLINNICNDNNGIITASQASDSNIPTWYLSDMVRKGDLVRVDRGIYTARNGDYDEYFFFQQRNKRCIYSYSSALYLLGMTDRIPFQKEVTAYKGYNSKHISDGTIIHYVSRKLHNLGVVEIETIFGNTVKTYNRERTICDIVYARKNIDVEIFSKAIRAYANSPDRDYKKLRSYAAEMKIAEKIDDLLEVI